MFFRLNEYYGLVAPIIRNNHGSIAKYAGDGFMAIFPGGGEHALACAVQMQSAIAGWNRKNPARIPIRVGIGIDFGRTILGTVGDAGRIDGTVLSDCVRSAGCFEAETKRFHSSILINESVIADLPNPQAWFIRPVDQIDTGSRLAFLFEVYNNDPEDLRDRKWKSQDDLERGVFAWHAGRREEACMRFEEVLATHPSDFIAKHYLDQR